MDNAFCRVYLTNMLCYVTMQTILILCIGKNTQLESVLTNFVHLFNFICLEKLDVFLSGKW